MTDFLHTGPGKHCGAPSVRACPYAARVDVTLLLIEDTTTLREATSAYLGHAGFRVLAVESGEQGLAAVASERVDLVLLDLMLPGMGGHEVARRMRALRPNLPIIMVTARGQEHERIAGLAAGADDYVTKPYSLRELDLRIRSVLRRTLRTGPPEPPEPDLRDGDLQIDIRAHTVRRAGEQLALTAREFDLLLFLVRQPGLVWSREELLRRVWGWEVGDASTVTVHVRRLREKVEADPSRPVRLLTVFGQGYRWAAADEG